MLLNASIVPTSSVQKGRINSSADLVKKAAWILDFFLTFLRVDEFFQPYADEFNPLQKQH